MGLFAKKVQGFAPAIQTQGEGDAGNDANPPPLLVADELPEGFVYPRGLLRLVELDLCDLEPWLILTGHQLRSRNHGLAERYPDRNLIPFARRQDNDAVACWDVGTGTVAIVHDFASPGWENQGEFEHFDAWLHSAIEDLIEF
ncbi:hypothetical protein M1D51_17215 [Arthrobacter sp. R3-55]|uniref:hypothetical protein n=1 Tax=Paenarthrobacter sp. CM16 TaxID=2738447 RepID=UPI0020A6682B|nr:hypothetical protein [Paenarthrobacter sp. CM16]